MNLSLSSGCKGTAANISFISKAAIQGWAACSIEKVRSVIEGTAAHKGPIFSFH